MISYFNELRDAELARFLDFLHCSVVDSGATILEFERELNAEMLKRNNNAVAALNDCEEDEYDEIPFYPCFNCEVGAVYDKYDLCNKCQHGGTGHCTNFDTCHGLINVNEGEWLCPKCRHSEKGN